MATHGRACISRNVWLQNDRCVPRAFRCNRDAIYLRRKTQRANTVCNEMLGALPLSRDSNRSRVSVRYFERKNGVRRVSTPRVVRAGS